MYIDHMILYCIIFYHIILYYIILFYIYCKKQLKATSLVTPHHHKQEAVMDKKWTWPEIHEMVQQILGRVVRHGRHGVGTDRLRLSPSLDDVCILYIYIHCILYIHIILFYFIYTYIHTYIYIYIHLL